MTWGLDFQTFKAYNRRERTQHSFSRGVTHMTEKLHLTKIEHRILVSLHLQGIIQWGRLARPKRVAVLESLQGKGLLDSDGSITPAGVQAGAPFNENVEIV